MVDISGSIDTSALQDGQVMDAADVLDPIEDLIGVVNNLLNGAQAFDQINFSAATELTIASGAITVTKSVHTVDTESDAASDDLTTITMAEGDVAFLRAADGSRTVVIKDGSDNIVTSTGEDIELDSTAIVVLVIRIGSLVYVVGGSGVTEPINAGVLETMIFL